MKKEKMFWFYLLSFTWGILFTLIGLLALAFIFMFLNHKIYMYKRVAGRLAIIFKRDLPGGMNLGLIYITDKSQEKNYRLHTHEIGHSIQNAWFGPLFIPIIAIPSLIRASFWSHISRKKKAKTGKYPDYDRIWFEGQATKLGEQYVGERVRRIIGYKI